MNRSDRASEEIGAFIERRIRELERVVADSTAEIDKLVARRNTNMLKLNEYMKQAAAINMEV